MIFSYVLCLRFTSYLLGIRRIRFYRLRLSSLTMESDTEKSKAWIFTRWNRKFVSYVGFELQYLLGLYIYIDRYRLRSNQTS